MENKCNFAKMTLAFVLAVGVAAVWLTLAGWLSSFVLRSNGPYESLMFTPEGEPIIQVGSAYQDHSYRGLDGQARVFNSESMWLSPATAAGARDDSWPRPKPSWPARIAPLSDGGVPPTFWYFIHDGRTGGSGYFVGYDSNTKEVVGYITRAGFRDAAPVSRSDQFATPISGPYSGLQSSMVSSQGIYAYGGVREPWYFNSNSRGFPGWRAYLIDGNRVVEVDLRRRDAPPKTLLEAEGLRSLAILHAAPSQGLARPAAAGAPADSDNEIAQNDLLIASTDAEVILYDPVADQTRRIERPAELDAKGLQVYRTTADDYILLQSKYDPETGVAANNAFTLTPQGEVQQHIEVQLNQGVAPSPNTQAAAASVVAPFPLAATSFVAAVIPLSRMNFDNELTYGQALSQSISESWLCLLLTFALSVVLAWRAYVRQRKMGDAFIVPWIVFILILGLPGYVAYRLHRRWPARLLCPACSRPSPCDHDGCIECGAELPPPELKGVEVFA